VAATRMLYAIGRRNLVHPSLGAVHPTFGTPVVAVTLMGVLTVAASAFGDAILVPISEVGSLAVGVGWFSTCAAYLARRPASAAMAVAGAVVSFAIILMKIVPGVPGSFSRAEWISFIAWSGLGLTFWLLRRRAG
jgi:APA family basic amino acid/polyamine antiporter